MTAQRRYHINPTSGEVNICRAKIQCRFGDVTHYESSDAARKAYEELQRGVFEQAEAKATVEQESFFKSTVVRDSAGALLPIYHGSSKTFDEFDSAYLGKGNDSWGNGFYFASQKSTADAYADGGETRAFYLDLRNPLKVDGKKVMSLNEVYFTSEEVHAIVSAHPDLTAQPNDEERMNPLGDYCPAFWDKETHTSQELEALTKELVRDYFSDSSFVELESFFGRDHGAAFLTAVEGATGHDGVEIDFGDDGRFFVAWRPNQMKLTSTLKPEATTQL